MIHNVNNILIIILIMLIMFCLCCYVFSYKYEQNNRNNRNTYNHLDNQIDHNIQLLELLTQANKNASYIIKKHKLDEALPDTHPDTHPEDNINNINNINNNTEKEPFYNVIDERLISQNQSAKYILNLRSLTSWLDNQYIGPNGVVNKIKQNLYEAQDITKINKYVLLNFLTNAYVVNYLNMNNKMNAESYKVLLKYKEPSNNKYYKQYTK